MIIRTDDPGWIATPRSGGACQLTLLLRGARGPNAQPLLRSGRHNGRPQHWLEALDRASIESADDERVCPAVTPGQLALFHLHRQLTEKIGQRIADRVLRGSDATRAAALAYGAEQGFSKVSAHRLARVARLALAARDADGEHLVPLDVLDDLPRSKTVAVVLRRAGILGTDRRDVLPAARRPRPPARRLSPRDSPRSCHGCGCWGMHQLPECGPCRNYRHSHALGTCGRCLRADLPTTDDLCRACLVHVAEHGPDSARSREVQLWFGGDFALRLAMRQNQLGYIVPAVGPARRRAAERRPSPLPLSPHLIGAGQEPLFAARRDWSRIRHTREHLPTLSVGARTVMAQFGRYAQHRRLHVHTRRDNARALYVVLAWLGADAPISEADLTDLALTDRTLRSRHAVRFLAESNRLLPDSDRRVAPGDKPVHRRIDEFEEPLAAELRRWVQVLRGEGRRPHPAVPFTTISKYLASIIPTLRSWALEYDSLREVTSRDVRSSIDELRGNPAKDRATALRSLFRALKQERLIFHDPTRGISRSSLTMLPSPIPTDRLRGLLDRADGPMAKLVVALVAIHGLGLTTVRRALVSDLDLSRGRMILRLTTGQHTIYLDEVTHALSLAWLRERYRRWPVTTNPHLLLTRQTGSMAGDPPVSPLAVLTVFATVGIRAAQLRRDRILEEARVTADPVHLMRVFGISVTTAMRYVYAAHPERKSTLPR